MSDRTVLLLALGLCLVAGVALFWALRRRRTPPRPPGRHATPGRSRTPYDPIHLAHPPAPTRPPAAPDVDATTRLGWVA